MRIAGQRDRQWNLKSLICAENSEIKGLKLKKQKFLSDFIIPKQDNSTNNESTNEKKNRTKHCPYCW